MATFVHLCDAKAVRSIRRRGIVAAKRRRGVYAMPTSTDFYVSHQWLRELSRWIGGPMVAVYFRVPSSTPAMFGPYGGPHRNGTAGEAVAALIRGEDKSLGFETIILRDIAPAEITSCKPLRQVIGWRYYPSAKGRKPCGCPACQTRGEPFSRRFREPVAVRMDS